jgi:hypothetical protein
MRRLTRTREIYLSFKGVSNDDLYALSHLVLRANEAADLGANTELIERFMRSYEGRDHVGRHRPSEADGEDPQGE